MLHFHELPLKFTNGRLKCAFYPQICPTLRGCGGLGDLCGPVFCSSRFWPGPGPGSVLTSAVFSLAGGVGRRRGLLVVPDGRQVVLQQPFTAPVRSPPGPSPAQPPYVDPGPALGDATCTLTRTAVRPACPPPTFSPSCLCSHSDPQVQPHPQRALVLQGLLYLPPSWDINLVGQLRLTPSLDPMEAPPPNTHTHGTLGSGGGSYQEATPLPLSLGHFLLGLFLLPVCTDEPCVLKT